MNRRIGFIAVLFVLLSGMALALFLITRTREAPPQTAQAAVEDYIYTAGNGGAAALVSVTIRNSHGTYTLNGGYEPVINGFEDIDMDTYQFIRILGIASQPVSRGLVTADAADAAVFGLAPPQAEIFIQPESGEAITLLVGSSAPDGVSMYVQRAGAPAVYLTAAYEAALFLQSPFDFVSTVITPAAGSAQNGEIVFSKIILGGSVRQGGNVAIENTGRSEDTFRNPCRITSPVNAAMSMDRGTSVLDALFGLSADRVVAKIASNGELDRYGLSAPWSTAEISGTPESGIGNFRLRASKPNNAGTVYVQREGTPLIYEAAVSKLPWLEVSWFDLMERLIILPFIDSIASVDIKTPERTVSFSVSGEGDELAVKAGAVTVDAGNFRSYYQTLISAMYDEYSDAAAASLPPPFLEIVYHYRDSTQPADTVSFHRASSRRVLTSLNRSKPYFTLSAYTDQVLADLDLILSGQQVRSYL